MPIQDDSLLDQPPPDAKLWRYMDVSKLAALLSTRTLFFARADKFDDKWEGAVSPNDLEAWEEMVGASGESPADRDLLVRNYRRTFQGLRRHTYISCWHENDGESVAMWKLYLKSDEGIAMQTTFARLRAELNESPRFMHLGRVRCRDYTKESISGGRPAAIGRAWMIGPFAPFTQKRRGFVHEAEVRALFQDYYKSLDDASEHEYGLAVPVDIERLVEDVYVAPETPAWLCATIQDILNKFGLDRDVRSSAFDDPPAC
jgi:hypothetical protein